MPDRFSEIVIEASSGYVLSEKNADKPLYPASLTKLMTMYLTFEALDTGKLYKNQRIFISKRASSQEPSSLGLETGEALRVEDAILAITTKSANDCAVALAETLGENEPRFARIMTQKARELGMLNTRFVNASGLYNPAQVSTARDMSILAQALLRDYPKYYHYFGTDSFTYNGNEYLNHNKLMNSYQGMDGLKTGYVYASGYNLAASAVRNGTRLIGVVFGGKTANSRNKIMAQLLDQGFSNVQDIRVASQIDKRRDKMFQPLRKSVTLAALPNDAEIAYAGEASAAARQSPQFDAMGLAVDQGDTDIEDRPVLARKTQAVTRIIHGLPPLGKKNGFLAEFQPRSLNIKALESTPRSSGKGSGWAIQVGAFSSHAAGVKALDIAKSTLRDNVQGTDSIAPLMTNRGMVYRARLSGLARNDAAQACQILRGNCLVLSVE